MLRTLETTRYITPLREGGSLPAVVAGEDNALYVLKFRGAGQGPKALVAELVAGEIGRALGLHVPELVFMTVSQELGRSEADPEIQALVSASAGLNLALAYLPGALAYDPLARPAIDPLLASQIVWFDAYVTNVDRTARNTNMLWWNHQLWLIDHGASLYMHHTWTDYLTRSRSPFTPIKEHVLLPFAEELLTTDAVLRERLTVPVLENIVGMIPDEWLDEERGIGSRAEVRAAYLTYLLNRLDASSVFVEEALHARAQLV